MPTINHKAGKYPLFNINTFNAMDDSECYFLPLTKRQIHFILDCIGRDNVPFTAFVNRWYVSRNGEKYEVIEKSLIDSDIIPFIDKLKGILVNYVCTNEQLTNIADVLASIKEAKQEEITIMKGNSISLQGLIDAVKDNQSPSLSGALDTLLKIQELLGLIPNIDIQINTGELIKLMLQFRQNYIQRQMMERVTKYLGVMATSMGGGDVVAIAETAWDALPLTDFVDEFSEIPEITIDFMRLLTSYLTTSQIDATLEISNAIKQCCDKEKGGIEVIQPLEYPQINGSGHTHFCEQLATLMGLANSVLQTIQSNVANSYPPNVSVSTMLANVIRVMYGIDVNSGGRGMSKLFDLASNPSSLAGFSSTFDTIIPTIMASANCKGSASDIMDLIIEAMGFPYAPYKDAFYVLLPPSRVQAVITGNHSINETYYLLYGGGCSCGSTSNQPYPIIDIFRGYPYTTSLIKEGYLVPFSDVSIVAESGYIMTTEESITAIGNRIVSVSETLRITVAAWPYEPFIETSLPVTIEVGGVGQTIGSFNFASGPQNIQVLNWVAPKTGVPKITIGQDINGVVHRYALQDIWLTFAGE